MDPIAKEVWCEALRSGEFNQCRSTLKSKWQDNAFCCLGVAREVFPALNSTADHDLLSRSALDLLGLTTSHQHKLASMNDEGRGFDEIADWIEANL